MQFWQTSMLSGLLIGRLDLCIRQIKHVWLSAHEYLSFSSKTSGVRCLCGLRSLESFDSLDLKQLDGVRIGFDGMWLLLGGWGTPSISGEGLCNFKVWEWLHLPREPCQGHRVHRLDTDFLIPGRGISCGAQKSNLSG